MKKKLYDNNNYFLTRRLSQQGDFQRGHENRGYKKKDKTIKSHKKFPALKT